MSDRSVAIFTGALTALAAMLGRLDAIDRSTLIIGFVVVPISVIAWRIGDKKSWVSILRLSTTMVLFLGTLTLLTIIRSAPIVAFVFVTIALWIAMNLVMRSLSPRSPTPA
jgi:hypothetical protein